MTQKKSLTRTLKKAAPYVVGTIMGGLVIAAPYTSCKVHSQTEVAQKYHALESKPAIQEFKKVEQKLSAYSDLEKQLEVSDEIVDLKNRYVQLYHHTDSNGKNLVQEYRTALKEYNDQTLDAGFIGLLSIPITLLLGTIVTGYVTDKCKEGEKNDKKAK